MWCGSRLFLAARSASAEGFGALEVAGRAVVAAHGVMVCDRGAVAVQDIGRGGLAVVPDLDRVAGAAFASSTFDRAGRSDVGPGWEHAARGPATG